MKEKRIIQKLIFLIYLGLVAYLCFGHFDSLPNVSRSYFGIPTDKIVHFLMFLPLPLLLYWSFNWKTDKVYKTVLLTLALLIVGLCASAATEYGQGLTNYRSKDLLDFKADMIAVNISACCVFVIDMVKNIRKAKKHETK